MKKASDLPYTTEEVKKKLGVSASHTLSRYQYLALHKPSFYRSVTSRMTKVPEDLVKLAAARPLLYYREDVETLLTAQAILRSTGPGKSTGNTQAALELVRNNPRIWALYTQTFTTIEATIGD